MVRETCVLLHIRNMSKKDLQKCQLTITLEFLLLEFPLYDLLTTPHVTTTQSNVFSLKTWPKRIKGWYDANQ